MWLPPNFACAGTRARRRILALQRDAKDSTVECAAAFSKQSRNKCWPCDTCAGKARSKGILRFLLHAESLQIPELD